MTDGTAPPLAALTARAAWMRAHDVACGIRRHETLMAVEVRHSAVPPVHLLAEYRGLRGRLIAAEADEAERFAEWVAVATRERQAHSADPCYRAVAATTSATTVAR